MGVLDKGIVFDIDERNEAEDRACDIEESEQNLEEEANRMVKSWDRDRLLKEIDADKESGSKLPEQNHEDYYDGETEFKDMFPDMEEFGNGMVYFKKLESNPEGREIQLTSTIQFDQIAYFEFNPNPWQSSFHDGKRTTWNLKEVVLLVGWEAVLTMLREGESANFILHPAVAFGKFGAPPLVPGDTYIFWHIKIHKVWDESLFGTMVRFEKDTHVELPFGERVALINEHKQVANRYLKDEQYREALIRYKAAIKYIELMSEEDYVENYTLVELRAILYQNAAITFNKLKMHKCATKAAKKSLNSNPTNLKAYYQLIKARIELNDHTSALDYLDRVKNLAPDNVSFNHLRIQVDSRSLKEREERDKIMKKMGMAFA